MSQQVANLDDVGIPSQSPPTLTCPQRLDGPHWFFSHVFEEDGSVELHKENPSMSWQSKMNWWCDPREWLRTIVNLKDTPHSIALGTAIGVFIGLTPTFGIQMLLVLTVSLLTRRFFPFNRIAALVGVYVSNPFTMLPIYWFNYRLGAIFMHSEMSWEEFVKLFHYSHFTEWWSTISNVFYTLGAPLIVGSLLVASVCSLPTYPLMLRLVDRVQVRQKARKLKRTIEEASPHLATVVAESESPTIPEHDSNVCSEARLR